MFVDPCQRRFERTIASCREVLARERHRLIGNDAASLERLATMAEHLDEVQNIEEMVALAVAPGR